MSILRVVKPALLGILAVTLALTCAACVQPQHPKRSVDSIADPYRFSITRWIVWAIPSEIKNRFQGASTDDDGVGAVSEYFDYVREIRRLRSEMQATGQNTRSDLAALENELHRLERQTAALEEVVEQVLRTQVQMTVKEQGIFSPIGLRVSFPPVSFKLAKPPHLLVISPRDRIEIMHRVILDPGIGLENMESIEREVGRLGLSALVVELGGLALYPSFVKSEASLRYTLDTIIEEWAHHYLAFKPLGFRYVLDSLGLVRNYDVAVINETVASIFSKELGDIICQQYYAGCYEPVKNDSAKAEFDFNREMRETRKTVDEYLAGGRIEEAEIFMEEQRQYLAANGYYIRKLNQAYFAFHGTYADSPTSIDPIGVELKQLREQSDSLKHFLNTVGAITSREDLRTLMEQ